MQVTAPHGSGSAPEKTMPGKNCFAFLKGQRQRCVFLQIFFAILLKKAFVNDCLAVVVVEVAVSSMRITAEGVGNC